MKRSCICCLVLALAAVGCGSAVDDDEGQESIETSSPAEVQSPSSEEDLVKQLDDPDPSTRIKAVQALRAGPGGPSTVARTAIEKLLDDDDKKVKEAAKAALQQ